MGKGKCLRLEDEGIITGRFKLELDHELFEEIIEYMEKEKVAKYMTLKKGKNPVVDGVQWHLDYKEVWSILQEIDGVMINQKIFDDNVVSNYSKALFIILCKKSNGLKLKQIELPVSLMVTYVFLILFFFNIDSPSLVNDHYSFCLDSTIREIFESLVEIEQVTKESFDLILQVNASKEHAIIELGEPFREALLLKNL